MKALRRSAATGWLLAGAAICLIQLLLAWRASHHRLAIETKMEERTRTWNHLAQAPIPPTADNREAFEQERARVQEEESILREALLRKSTLALREGLYPPASLYFELMDFAERMGEEVRARGIRNDAGQSFGFERFAEAKGILLHDPPETSRSQRALAVIDHQRQILEALLPLLFAAGPASLETVERAIVIPLPEDERNSPKGIIDPDVRMILAAPSGIGTTAVRLGFTGHTATLREFMRGLAALDLPLAVAAIEVATQPSHRLDHPGSSGRGAASATFALLGGTPPAAPVEEETPPGIVRIVEAHDSIFTILIQVYAVGGFGREVAAE